MPDSEHANAIASGDPSSLSRRVRVTAREIRGELASGSRLAANLSAGLVVGLVAVVMTTSLTVLVFDGPLAPRMGAGVGFGMFGLLAFSLVTAFSSSYPGIVSRPQTAQLTILAVMSGAFATALGPGASVDELFGTVVGAIVATSLLAALVFGLMGRYRLGNLTRYVPYPVVGGVTAGIGWLVFAGGFELMAGEALSLRALPALFEGPLLVRWGPGLGFGVLVLLVLRRVDHFLVIPSLIAGGIAVFYGVLAGLGMPLGAATERGLLLGASSGGASWAPPGPGTLAGAHWSLIFGQAGSMLAAVAAGILDLLVGCAALEVVTRRTIDLNRELRVAGVANALAALGGGPTGHQSMNLSTLGFRVSGQASRVIGLTVAACALGALFYVHLMLAYLPVPILGGVLCYLGLSYLVEWLWDMRAELSRVSYAIVALIVVVMGTAGFLSGVMAGIGVAMVLFVAAYSRIDVVKQALTGASYRSNVDRPPAQERLLEEEGRAVQILKLQGYLFFGTAHALVERLHAAQEASVRFVVLDFREVSGVDASALNSFVRLGREAEEEGFTLVLAGLSEALQAAFERAGLLPGKGKEGGQALPLRVAVDLDRGMEWCEDRMLEAADLPSVPAERALASLLSEERAEASALEAYFEREEREGKACLLRQGGGSDALYFLAAGRLTARLEESGAGKSSAGSGARSDEGARLRVMGPGTVVGEIGFYLERAASATVETEAPSVLYRLTRPALRRMEEEEPELASALHRSLVRKLGARLAYSNEALAEVLR